MIVNVIVTFTTLIVPTRSVLEYMEAIRLEFCNGQFSVLIAPILLPWAYSCQYWQRLQDHIAGLATNWESTGNVGEKFWKNKELLEKELQKLIWCMEMLLVHHKLVVFYSLLLNLKTKALSVYMHQWKYILKYSYTFLIIGVHMI